MQYLITDIRTNAQTWVSGETVRAALIAHENAWRTQKLPATAKVSSYSEGAIIDASLGESACRGRRENVQRAVWRPGCSQPLFQAESLPPPSASSCSISGNNR